MVDIVRRGENLIDCTNCDSTLRYYSSDVKSRTNPQGQFWYTGTTTNGIYPNTVSFITCPVCDNDVYLPSQQKYTIWNTNFGHGVTLNSDLISGPEPCGDGDDEEDMGG